MIIFIGRRRSTRRSGIRSGITPRSGHEEDPFHNQKQQERKKRERRTRIDKEDKEEVKKKKKEKKKEKKKRKKKKERELQICRTSSHKSNPNASTSKNPKSQI